MKSSYSKFLFSYFISPLFLCLFLLSGCKKDFKITANYKEVPVVYGLLNWNENPHYIRIQKGYLIDGNANVAAGVYDSIYYPNVLTVKLIPYYNGAVSGSTFTLNRVNGNDIGLPKETGMFASDSNILYSFTGTLDPTKRYKLEVTNNSDGSVFQTAKEGSLEGVTLVNYFAITNPKKVHSDGDKINLQNISPARVVFNPALNAGIYDLVVRFYYKEYRQSDNVLLKDTFAEITLFKSYLPDGTGNNIVADLSADIVLGYLSNNLSHDNSIYREFNMQKGIQVIVSAGGIGLTTYLNSQMAQSGGLASNGALAPFTNIIGGEGLLSSRYIGEVDSVLLSDKGLDTLACSDMSRALRFTNHNGQICN